jgi:hypothetical protein
MSKLKAFLKDYRTLKKRIEIEHEVRARGGLSPDVYRAWDQDEVATIPSSAEDLRFDSLILAAMRHPLKSLKCISRYSLEKKQNADYLQ